MSKEDGETSRGEGRDWIWVKIILRGPREGDGWVGLAQRVSGIGYWERLGSFAGRAIIMGEGEGQGESEDGPRIEMARPIRTDQPLVRGQMRVVGRRRQRSPRFPHNEGVTNAKIISWQGWLAVWLDLRAQMLARAQSHVGLSVHRFAATTPGEQAKVIGMSLG